jgi:hypothetical protein
MKLSEFFGCEKPPRNQVVDENVLAHPLLFCIYENVLVLSQSPAKLCIIDRELITELLVPTQ